MMLSKTTEMKLGFKDLIYIATIVIGITLSYITNKLTTEFKIENLSERVAKIEKVNPEKLQWELSNLSSIIVQLSEGQAKINSTLQVIYEAVILEK